MSTEQLRADFAANSETIKALDPALTSTTDLVNLIKFTIWPYIENIVTEVSEVDETVQDMVDGVDDILHEETAGVIAAPIIAARQIIAAFKATLPPTATDQLKAIREWEEMAKEAEELISEIVIHDAPDDDDDDDGDEDEDDDKEKR